MQALDKVHAQMNDLAASVTDTYRMENYGGEKKGVQKSRTDFPPKSAQTGEGPSHITFNVFLHYVNKRKPYKRKTHA